MFREVIAIDLGGTNLRIARVKNSKILDLREFKTADKTDKLIEQISSGIEEFISWKTIGIGVSSPGPLENGVIKNPPNLPFRDFDLKNYLKNKFEKKVKVENDANCVALAESRLGCNKKNFIVLTFGTGVGGGVIIDGKLYKGYDGDGYGGELGHIIIDNKKTLETHWKYHKLESKKCFGRSLMIKELLMRNDRDSKRILNYTYDHIAMGIASLVHVFDPEVIIITGGVKDAGNLFLSEVRKRTARYIITPRKPNIFWSNIDKIGVIGASLLV